MNTGNKLNKPKKKSVSKPVASKPVASKMAVSNKPTKVNTGSKVNAASKPVTKAALTTVSSPKKVVANKSVSKSKQLLPKASQKKDNAPIEEKTKIPSKLQIQHTKKRYVDLKLIIDKMRENTNAANNFEDAYKIEGNGMSREEYKRRKS